jgi:hypothetical protein
MQRWKENWNLCNLTKTADRNRRCTNRDNSRQTVAEYFFGYIFLGLECVGHSFAYVAHFVFLRDVWIRTQRAALADRSATNLATHLPTYPPIPLIIATHLHVNTTLKVARLKYRQACYKHYPKVRDFSSKYCTFLYIFTLLLRYSTETYRSVSGSGFSIIILICRNEYLFQRSLREGLKSTLFNVPKGGGGAGVGGRGVGNQQRTPWYGPRNGG